MPRDFDWPAAKIQLRATILSGITPLGIPRIVKVWCIHLKEGEALFSGQFIQQSVARKPGHMIQPPFSISAARAALCTTWMIALAILWLTLTPQALPKSQSLPLDKVAHMAAVTALVLPVTWMAPRSPWLLVPLALGLGGAI